MKTRVYLDTCCYNRSFDDKTNMVVRLEARAVRHVQEEIRKGNLELAWSFVLESENIANPHVERKNAVAVWKCFASVDIASDEEIFRRGYAIEKLGIGYMDALHIACAVTSGCRYFLTTDRKVLNKRVKGILLRNPLDFAREMEAQ